MKAEILELVKPTILTRGFAKLTSDEIARIAGVSKRTLYRYFRSKEEIVLEITADLRTSIQAMFDAELNDRSREPLDRLRRIVEQMAVTVNTLAPQFLLDIEKQMPLEFKKIVAFREARLRTLAQLLHEGQQTGSVRKDLDPPLSIEILLAAVNGVLRPSFLASIRHDFKSSFEALFDQFLYGIVLRPQGLRVAGRSGLTSG
ncbi:MAG: TetR/AcrR family transcriptional regulator [Leptospirales bacterium]|nr:TetR/AcrR family transcriptional regulator [Leptospirales bacterium]